MLAVVNSSSRQSLVYLRICVFACLGGAPWSPPIVILWRDYASLLAAVGFIWQ
jgi:hypothetical protein